MSKPALEDYIEVPERIQRFYEKYPEGSLQGTWEVVSIGADEVIVYTARAYRSPADELPGIGTASEPYPGKTSFTRGSELMNAETSAWGRAIVALGFLAKDEKVASAEEVKLAKARNAKDQPVPDVHDGKSFEKKLDEQVADLPGTTELLGPPMVAALKKLRSTVGVSPAALKAHVVATHSKDSLDALTLDEGKMVTLWLEAKLPRKRAA